MRSLPGGDSAALHRLVAQTSCLCGWPMRMHLSNEVFELKLACKAASLQRVQSDAAAPHSTTWPPFPRPIRACVLECAGAPALSISLADRQESPLTCCRKILLRFDPIGSDADRGTLEACDTHSDFVINSAFVIRISSFSFMRSLPVGDSAVLHLRR